MMGKQSGQIQMAILDIDSMIPENHLLRRIKKYVNFDFIYEKAAPYYSHVGRKSIDPVVLIKMLLIGYLYGIKSERRLDAVDIISIPYRKPFLSLWTKLILGIDRRGIRINRLLLAGGWSRNGSVWGCTCGRSNFVIF